MGSVRPHRQAVAYPAFQHWRDIGAFTSPLDSTSGVPVVHHAKGHGNMVGTLYPEEVRVAYSPAQWQQGSTQSKQNFQGYTQHESQRTLARTRFQQPNSGNSSSSSKHVSAQHSSSFGTTANENTVRDSVNEGGQQSGCSEQKGSNLNINPGLSQKQLNTFSVCTADTFAAQKKSVPLLYAVLTSNSSSSSGEANANIELDTNTHFSDDGDCQSQQVKSSLAALNCGKSRKLNEDHSGATHSSTRQQQASFPDLCSQPSRNRVLPVGKMAPPTDDEIMEFIREKIEYFRTLLNPENINRGLAFQGTFNGWNFCSNEGNPTPQSDCIISNDVAHSRSTSTSDKDAAAVGETLQQDSSKGLNENATLTAKSRAMSHCATSASKEHSTEYPQIMEKVAATCTKNEDETPVVLTAVSEMDSAKLTENQPSSSLNCSSSQEEPTPVWLNIVKTLDDIEQMSGVSCALKHTRKREKGDTVYSLKDPQYDDISDDELSALKTKLPNKEHEELRYPANSEDLQYEYVSEDENSQIENVALGKSSLAQVPTGNGQLPCENKSYGHEKVQAQMKTEIILEQELIPRKQVSPETKTCIPCSPSSVLKDGDEIDDQMDDDWIVIPLSMYDLKFEPEDEEQDSPEKVVLDNGETGDKETESDRSPLPASLPSQIEVFDTLEKFLQQKSLHGFGWRSACSTPEHELDSSMPSHTLQSRSTSYSESEDSYDTEDSCDYPFESKQNLLTVSSELLAKGSTPAMDDSESEKESEDDEVINVQRPGELIKAKAASEYVKHESNGQISKIDDIIVIDSDTEDDSDQNCRTMAKRKTISSDSDDSGDAPCSQYSPKKKLQKKKHKQSMSEERRNTKRTHSSESEDSSDALIAGKIQPSTETMERICGTAKKKSEEPRLSSEDAAKKQLQTVGKEVDSTLHPNPVIHRFVVHNSTQPTEPLKLIKESRVHSQGNDETRAPKDPKGTSKNTDPYKKKMQHLHKKVKVPASKAKPKQLSSPSQEGPSISTVSLSSTSGQLYDPRQSSASSKGLFQTGETSTSCSLPKSKQRRSIPRQNMPPSNEQLSCSYSIHATLDTCTPTKDPPSSESMLSTTRKQVIQDWKDTFFPTKLERKINLRKEVESKTTNLDSLREARPGPSHYDRAPRRRHSSHETVTPLMKKAKSNAIEWTKAINREDPKKRKSFSVGDNYKWSEKPTKGSYKSGKKLGSSPRSRQ